MRDRNYAMYFAAGAHAAVGQSRRYTKKPYIEHCQNVVRILDTAIRPHEYVLCAAFLHDVLEDTKVNRSTLVDLFGTAVTNLVDQVTDVATLADGNRAARKAIERDHLAKGCADAQNIKIADMIDNTMNIVQHDPKFARIYLPEKRLLLGVLTKADERLRKIARDQIEASEHALGLSRQKESVDA